MKLLDEKFACENRDFIISEMNAGKIFIYPTDTVYGIGCDATNDSAATKIYDIKRRDGKPFLVIAPGFDWITESCEVKEAFLEKIKKKLPGPYSFIVKLKDKGIISDEVSQGRETVGVRIPNSFFSEVVKEFGKPFVTTSVNFSGESPALKVSDISEEILDKVDYVIESDSELRGVPSEIYDVTGDEIKRLR